MKRFDWLLIIQPDLNCRECYQRQDERGETPLCQTKEGCPIEDIAQSLHINNLITGYVKWQDTVNMKAPLSWQEQVLEDYGLDEYGYELLSDLNAVRAKYLEQQKEQNDRDREHKKQVAEAKRKARSRF